MYASDLNIEKHDREFVLTHNGDPILCMDTDDPVAHPNKGVIEHIADDLDRCGDFSMDANNRLETGDTFCAYTLFSMQKKFIEDPDFLARFRSMVLGFPIRDYSLIQVANGPPLEMEEEVRYRPVRNALKDALKDVMGEENSVASLKQLTSFAWGTYYQGMSGTAGPGEIIDEEVFKTSTLGAQVHEIVFNGSVEKLTALLALFLSNDEQSILVPWAYVTGGITKAEFVSASMVLAGSIADLPTAEGDNELHQEKFRHWYERAQTSFDYANLYVPYQYREESKALEFKASLRTPYPEMPAPQQDDKGQVFFKWGKSVFTSKKQIHKELENIVIKSCAAFMNTEGGKLVIGIHEYGNEKDVVGIDRENFESHDHYERHVSQVLNNAFGALIVSESIKTEIIKEDGQHLCVIHCEKRIEDFVAVGDDIWVRTGPRVDRLKPEEIDNARITRKTGTEDSAIKKVNERTGTVDRN